MLRYLLGNITSMQLSVSQLCSYKWIQKYRRFVIKQILKQMTSTNQEVNVILRQTAPQKKSQDFYVPVKVKKTAFSRITGPETHLLRRQMILKKYPEVQELMKSTSNISYYLTVFVVLTQLSMAYLLMNLNWIPFLVINYIVGGTLGHMSHVLIHDFTHSAGDASSNVNRFFAMINNIATGLPSAISFGKYHSDHHNFLNQEMKDPDLPLNVEAKYVNTKVRKGLFLFFITLVYGLRPVFYYNRPMNRYEFINYFTILAINVMIYKLMGPAALAYILISGFLSIGPHPAAFHILAEHFEYVNKMETYDYLGKFNIINLNIGYHLEHHDFPTIPWYNLPALRAKAPEFYEQFPLHTDYFEVAYKFVMEDNFTLYQRVIRSNNK